jgi:hypothetical protein
MTKETYNIEFIGDDIVGMDKDGVTILPENWGDVFNILMEGGGNRGRGE